MLGILSEWSEIISSEFSFIWNLFTLWYILCCLLFLLCLFLCFLCLFLCLFLFLLLFLVMLLWFFICYIWHLISISFVMMMMFMSVLSEFPGMVKCSLSILQVALSGDDVVINSKVWNEIIFIMMILISLKLLWSSSFGFSNAIWEHGWVACWNGFLLSKFPLMFECNFSISQITLGCDNVMINSEIWDEIILIMMILIGLKLLYSSGFGISHTVWEIWWVACWYRLLLSKFPLMTEFTFSIFQIALGCDDVMINTEVWDKVVFVMMIHISLKFLWSSSLGFSDTIWEYWWVTCWDGLFLHLNHLPCMI